MNLILRKRNGSPPKIQLLRLRAYKPVRYVLRRKQTIHRDRRGRFVNHTDNNSKPLTFAEAVLRAAALCAQGAKGRNAAASLLVEHCYGRLIGYMKSHGRMPESEAEEVAADVFLNFVTKPIAPECPPEVWFWRIARSELIDWARKRNALKRGGNQGKTEIVLDDDDFLVLLDTDHGHTELPAWVRDCVHRAAVQMQAQRPERFHVLLMVFEDWSAEDVAVYFGAAPSVVTDKQKTAARDRLHRARLEAREFFKHCKD